MMSGIHGVFRTPGDNLNSNGESGIDIDNLNNVTHYGSSSINSLFPTSISRGNQDSGDGTMTVSHRVSGGSNRMSHSGHRSGGIRRSNRVTTDDTGGLADSELNMNTTARKLSALSKTFPSANLVQIHYRDGEGTIQKSIYHTAFERKRDGNGRSIVNVPIYEDELQFTLVPEYQKDKKNGNNNSNNNKSSFSMPRLSINKKSSNALYGYNSSLLNKSTYTPADWEPDRWHKWVPAGFMEREAITQWIDKSPLDRPTIFRFVEIFKKCREKKELSATMYWYNEIQDMKDVHSKVKKYLESKGEAIGNGRTIQDGRFTVSSLLETRIQWDSIDHLPSWQIDQDRQTYYHLKRKKSKSKSIVKKTNRTKSKNDIKTPPRKVRKVSGQKQASGGKGRQISKR